MKFISTRARSEPKTFKQILLEGLAPDGGLYMPESYPQLDLNMLRFCTYNETAVHVLSKFATDMQPSVIRSIVNSVYTAENFGSTEIAPISPLAKGLYLLKLSNGPTLAFKDIPLQLVCALMDHVLKEKGEMLNILGATSGDTGSAAAYAVRGKWQQRLFMLSPYGRMSRFQQQQMYTLNERNIFNLVVDGTFDDCQDVVKEVNLDADFKKKYNLGAVNSINCARILAQAVYHVYAGVQALKHHPTSKVVFSVPSGNFGNALSAYIAGKMGLPIEIVVATNENDVLDEFFRTGVYTERKKTEVLTTTSPSMDINKASNFERLIWDLADGEGGLVSNLWRDIARKGSFDAQFLMLEPSSPRIHSGKASEAMVLETIRDTYDRYKVIIDPHTAVGMAVGRKYWDRDTTVIVAETAQPAKFADTIRAALNIEVPVPKGYEELASLPEYTTRMPPNAEDVKGFIRASI